MYEPQLTNPAIGFRQSVRDLQVLLKSKNQDCMVLSFSGITLTVSADSVEDDVATIYDLKYSMKHFYVKKYGVSL